MSKIIVRLEAGGNTPRVSDIAQELERRYGEEDFSIVHIPAPNPQAEGMLLALVRTAALRIESGADLYVCLTPHVWVRTIDECEVHCPIVTINIADRQGPAQFDIISYMGPDRLSHGIREALARDVDTVKQRLIDDSVRSESERFAALELLKAVGSKLGGD